MAQTEFKKATSKNVLYTGIALIIIGGILTTQAKNRAGMGLLGIALIFFGFIASTFWIANRNDAICTFDDKDNMTCVDVKK